jgi:hypothetical protein
VGTGRVLAAWWKFSIPDTASDGSSCWFKISAASSPARPSAKHIGKRRLKSPSESLKSRKVLTGRTSLTGLTGQVYCPAVEAFFVSGRSAKDEGGSLTGRTGLASPTGRISLKGRISLTSHRVIPSRRRSKQLVDYANARRWRRVSAGVRGFIESLRPRRRREQPDKPSKAREAVEAFRVFL